MTILTKKFSEFSNGGDLGPTDIVVGLRNSINTKFSGTSPPPGSITWNDITDTSVTMESFNGYKANSAFQVLLLLPPTSLFGDTIYLVGFGVGGWRITQGAGQKIIIGSIESTEGVLGYVESTNPYDSVVLVCMEDNLTWQSLGSPQGYLDII